MVDVGTQPKMDVEVVMSPDQEQIQVAARKCYREGLRDDIVALQTLHDAAHNMAETLMAKYRLTVDKLFSRTSDDFVVSSLRALQALRNDGVV